MIKKNLKILIITSALILLPMLAGVILWEQLPAQIPIHWNIAGEVDGWSNKIFAVVGLPLFLLAIQWGCVVMTGADPKKENHSGKVLHLVFWIVPMLSVILGAIMYAVALGEDVQITAVLPLLLGLLFVIIGNYLPKCKQNYTIGIKIPWTLHSEENWNRTHRLAGRLWVIGGLLIILTGLLDLMPLIFVTLLVMVILPSLYSYLLHRRGI